MVNGARQVGKTWLITDFARRHFESTAHVVFLNSEEAQRAFDGSLDANRLLMLIGALTGTNPRVLPIEVKATQSVTGESLSNFRRTYELERTVRFSLRGHIDQGWLTNMPLYSIGRTRE